jgi:adenylate cyclase class 2
MTEAATLKHRSAIETEVKLRIPSIRAMLGMLEALGFRERHPAGLESSVLWDRGEELRQQASALRLRRYQGRAVLTWKGPKLPDPLLKVRPEIETEVAEPDAMEGILRAVGFTPVMEMSKIRAVWERDELVACLDETPFGAYLELEGEPQAIRLAMEHLALDAGHVEPRSYPTLYREAGLG